MNALDSYMHAKGAEYRAFDPSHARNLAKKLYECLRTDSRHSFIPPKTTIQIIGTNGKGSSGRFLAMALLQNGFSCVHFTSPHIFRFNERFYKNGAVVGDDELLQAHEWLQEYEYMREASYFEYATFLAYILAHGVDFLILEAGVGGEFDSTSALKRDVCAFSMIDFDHEEMLGNTIEKIAATKLNAMTSRAVIGLQKHTQVLEIARRIAAQKSIELSFVDSINPRALEYANKYHLAPFLAQNFSLSLKILETIGLDCDIYEIPKFDLRGRFESINPHITIDVGHNESAALAIKKSLKDKKVILVYNSYFQKNIRRILGILKDNIIRVEILKVDNDRIINQNVLEWILQDLGISYGEFKGMEKDCDYLVFGSFSVVENFTLQCGFK